MLSNICLRNSALALALIIHGLAFAADSIHAFGFTWSVPFEADWATQTEQSQTTLKLLIPRSQTKPRRPIQFALAETEPFERVEIEAEVMPLQTSLILIYAWQDEAHFNYVHLSSDTGNDQPVHNGVFHVFGADRMRISSLAGPAALPETKKWYRVKLVYDVDTGEVNTTVNGSPNPALHAIDLSLGPGRIGLGSFTETAFFRNVTIKGSHATGRNRKQSAQYP